MILGVGLDLVEVSRIEASLKRHGQRFLNRIATAGELKGAPARSPRRAQYWAARFAAKEAFAKALGTGIGKGVDFSSVGIKKNTDGKPNLEFSPAIARLLKKRGITRSHVSITHTAETAAAVVILEGSLK